MNLKRNSHLWTAFHIACYNSRYDIIKLLLQYNIDDTCKNTDGKTGYDLISDVNKRKEM